MIKCLGQRPFFALKDDFTSQSTGHSTFPHFIVQYFLNAPGHFAVLCLIKALFVLTETDVNCQTDMTWLAVGLLGSWPFCGKMWHTTTWSALACVNICLCFAFVQGINNSPAETPACLIYGVPKCVYLCFFSHGAPDHRVDFKASN